LAEDLGHTRSSFVGITKQGATRASIEVLADASTYQPVPEKLPEQDREQPGFSSGKRPFFGEGDAKSDAPGTSQEAA